MDRTTKYRVVLSIAVVLVMSGYFLLRPDQITRRFEFTTIDQSCTGVDMRIQSALNGTFHELRKEGHYHVTHLESPYSLIIGLTIPNTDFSSASVSAIDLADTNRSAVRLATTFPLSSGFRRDSDGRWTAYFNVDSIQVKHNKTLLRFQYELKGERIVKGSFEGTFEPVLKETKSRRFMDILMGV